MSTIETLSEQRCFGGIQGFYRFDSTACNGPMSFGVFQPPQAKQGRVPVIYCLAGLTCTPETFAIKAGAQRLATELGLMLVTPDTSPREAGIEGESESWDFGLGAGFYLDATEEPWSSHYRMYSHVAEELPALMAKSFPADISRSSVLGHSMGGHGALTLALKHPDLYRAVSAFAPIVAPMQVPWGEKAFSRFLGSNRGLWAQYDACELVTKQRFPGEILIDQGLDDNFLTEQLQPERFEAACKQAGQSLRLRRHAGYDHSYWFISSFVADHLRHHAEALNV